MGKDRYIPLSTGHPVDEKWDEVYGIQFEITRFGPNVHTPPTFDAQTARPIPAPVISTFLEGWIWLDEDGRVCQMAFRGAEANSTQNEDTCKLVESHPEWPDREAVDALRKREQLSAQRIRVAFSRQLSWIR